MALVTMERVPQYWSEHLMEAVSYTLEKPVTLSGNSSAKEIFQFGE